MGKKAVFLIKYALSPDTTMHDEALYGGGKSRMMQDIRELGHAPRPLQQRMSTIHMRYLLRDIA